MSNSENKKNKKNSKRLSLVLGGLSALSSVPSISAKAETARSYGLTALEQEQLDAYTKVTENDIVENKQFKKFTKSGKWDQNALMGDDVNEKCDDAVIGVQSLLGDIATIRRTIVSFSDAVESAFTGEAWRDPYPVWQIWRSWPTQEFIDKQKTPWTDSIKHLTTLKSLCENLSSALNENMEKYMYFLEDKKTASKDLSEHQALLASVLGQVNDGLNKQRSIDIPSDGTKQEALGWRKAMKSLRSLKNSATGEINTFLNSLERYLKGAQAKLESLPNALSDLKEKITVELKGNLEDSFYKKLDAAKKEKAAEEKRKEEERELQKAKQEKERQERERKRKEEEEERERQKAEQERLEREAKEVAEREEQERLAKMRSDFDGTRKKLIASLSDKIEKRKIYWNNVTNPADKTNIDIAEIMKSKFNVEHEKLDAAGRAKLSEMEALSEFSEDNLTALQALNDYPTQFGQQVADLNSAVSSAQEGLIKTKGDLLQYKADTLDDIAGKKSDFAGYVDKISLALRQETQPVFKKNIASTERTVVSGFDDLAGKLKSIDIVLTDKKLNDKISSIKQSMDGLLKKVELSKENILNQALKLKKEEVLKSLKTKQDSVAVNWATINKFEPSSMPDKLKPFATKCLQKASDQTKTVSQGLKEAMSRVDAYSLTNIDDDALDRIDVEQDAALSNHSALIAKLCEVLVNQLEIFRADRARMRLWDKIYGNLPISESTNDVKRLMEEEGLSKEEAVIKSCTDSLPGTDDYARTIVEGLFKPIERGQPQFTGIYCYGPSGIGKTESVKYIGECSGCQLVNLGKEDFMGSGKALAEDVYTKQTPGRPMLILIDEADTIMPSSGGKTRTESCGGFLTFMEHLANISKKANIVVVCTSNVAPAAIEPAAASRLSIKKQLGDTKYLSQGVSKLLEPVKLNQSMSKEQAISDIVGAVIAANARAQSPERQIGFRSIKMAILNVCKDTLKQKKSSENAFEQPFEQDEFVPKYDETEADVPVDPERIVDAIAKLV